MLVSMDIIPGLAPIQVYFQKSESARDLIIGVAGRLYVVVSLRILIMASLVYPQVYRRVVLFKN